MNIFFNHKEDRVRAGWRLVGQFFLLLLIGLPLTAGLSRLFSSSNSLIFGFSMTVAAVASTVAATRGLDKRPWDNFGIRFNKQWVKQCGLGFLLAGTAMGIIFLIEYLAGWLTVTGYGWQQTYESFYIVVFIGYFLFAILIGFWEELVFRGYQIVNLSEGLYSRFIYRKNAGIWAVVISSFVFGILHASNPNASVLSTINIMLAGAMLAFPFLVTGRLSYSIGLHIGWNFFQGGIFGFAVSGTINHASLLEITQNGPQLVTGGVFGPEAGLLGLAGMALIVGSLCWYFLRTDQAITIFDDFGVYTPNEGRHEA